jgi:Protein of unknown function (DUF3551)
MRRIMIAALAVSAVTVSVERSQAYVNYPWCIVGESRGLDCYFSTREQCMQDGRNRGFGSQCIRNPGYDPRQGPVTTGVAPISPNRQR